MNIIDYLKWRGDLSFKQDPFNEVDNLCLCHMTYTVFDDLIDYNSALTIRELSDLFFLKHSEEEIKASRSFVADAPYTLKELGMSRRFGDLRIANFVSILNEETTEQFCALQIDLGNGLIFVSFRGTDDTIIGWKEDFKITYEITRAQKSALNYVNKDLLRGRKYIFAGHSKGGNLAIYAAMNAPKRIRNRIVSVYSMDGPGIADEFIDEKLFQEIKDRYIKIVPEFDVFGMIYDHCENLKIVKSDSFFLNQHAATSWQVMGKDFEYLEDVSSESRMIKDNLIAFMNEVGLEKREDFVEACFGALNELGIKNVSDMSRASLNALIRAIKRFADMDEQNKETGYKLIKVFTDMISGSFNVKINETKEVIHDTLFNKKRGSK